MDIPHQHDNRSADGGGAELSVKFGVRHQSARRQTRLVSGACQYSSSARWGTRRRMIKCNDSPLECDHESCQRLRKTPIPQLVSRKVALRATSKFACWSCSAEFSSGVNIVLQLPPTRRECMHVHTDCQRARVFMHGKIGTVCVRVDPLANRQSRCVVISQTISWVSQVRLATVA